MKWRQQKRVRGFTLVEMLLVMVIISAVIYMGIGYVQQRSVNLRIDKTAAQIQQILNAALSYYVNNGKWPAPVGGSGIVGIPCLQGTGTGCTQVYLPSNIGTNPWGQIYYMYATTNLVFVYTKIDGGSSSGAYGPIIAGKLPLAFTGVSTYAETSGSPLVASGPCTSTSCWVVASVNVPGQNLNNASAVNYASLFHNGACVPAPTCPVDSSGNTMTPQIMVIPVSVTGANEDGTSPSGSPCSVSDTSGCTVNAYPLTSFTASAMGGDSSGNPVTTTGSSGPYSCGTTTPAPCYSTANTTTGAGITPIVSSTVTYWRVCLSVVTEKGVVTPATNVRGQLMGTVMAITKCVPPTEPTSSGFTVWSQ